MRVTNIKARLAKLWDQLRTSFWFLPATMVGATILLAFTTIAVDERLGFELIDSLGWLYTGDSEGARLLLSTVASSIIGIAGVTFSITIAALTMASSQFGPRLLRNFVRDVGNQFVLGTFIATFVYCLLVLRTIRGSEESTFIPHISVTIGVILAMMSIGVLIYFIHHVAMSIQADNVIIRASHELNTVIEHTLTTQGHDVSQQPNRTEEQANLIFPNRASYTVTAHCTGYVQVIDSQRLLQLATEQNIVIELLHCPGDFVVQGDAIATIWLTATQNETIDKKINNSLIIGKKRTLIQDIRFAINQVVEIAVRALSPGINDPFTAITCIDQLTASLCQITNQYDPSSQCYDDTHQLRLMFKTIQFEELADTAFSQIRQYGRTNAEVTLRLLASIATIMRCTSNKVYQDILLHHAAIIAHSGQTGLADSSDQKNITRCYEDLLKSLTP